MLRLPGTAHSLADAQAEGGTVHVVYSVAQAVDLARAHPADEVVFLASGFETTAVATAAVALLELPKNFSILSVHKWVPAAMEVVARSEETSIEGFIAAGHAAIITGWGLFEPFARKTNTPVVVAGFEPLDILAAIVKLTELMRDGKAEVFNAYPRCVTKEGNQAAQKVLWKVFEPRTGTWRGIAEVPDGNLDLKPEWAHLDARRRFTIDVKGVRDEQAAGLERECICGKIMMGLATPHDCRLYGTQCVPESPVGACMVSSEGTCRIWHTYGGAPDLRSVEGRAAGGR
jgi:hydrogenase expression/formation protein HypD